MFNRENVSLLFKLYCLTVMTLVAATYTVALRYTRTVGTELYFSTTAVCVTEVIKLVLSVGILAKETGSLTRLITSLKENVFGSPKELLKLSVPSVVTYQLKIPCTALCTVLMLNRTLSKLQWFSVFMLCVGVTLVQWEPAQATKVQVEQNPWLGFGAIAVAVLCSGFAGVYFEKVLKSSDTSLWVRNIQLYLSGIVVNLFVIYTSDGAKVLEKGFFYGYTYYVWFVIFLASVGGIYTSVVVKYTDNIMKGFSAAAAIVLSTVASVNLFGLQITFTFILGAVLVCFSIYFYGLPRQDTTKIQPSETTSSKERLPTVVKGSSRGAAHESLAVGSSACGLIFPPVVTRLGWQSPGGWILPRGRSPGSSPAVPYLCHIGGAAFHGKGFVCHGCQVAERENTGERKVCNERSAIKYSYV
ncbi:CMP-sialic acid transporter, partial [Lamprotornis superbus]